MSLHQPVTGGAAGGGGGAGTDELAKVSANDTVAGYLNGKLVAGSDITLTENNDGGNETLTIASTAAPADAPFAVFGSDGDLSAEVNLYDFIGVNLVMNSPGQIVIDGAEPQWWDDSANATITDEDCAGEGIEDKTERCFKVVTTGDDHYGYQTLTFSNESLLDAGQTVVSFSCRVYCASASVASIGIYGTNLGLQESSQHTGGGSWELLTVENQTLDAADASIQLRLICDTGTAYFTMPMLNPGSRSMPWKLRDVMFEDIPSVDQFDLNTTGDVAWSDTDCTANTHPLAVAITGWTFIREADGTVTSSVQLGHSDDITGSDSSAHLNVIQVLDQNQYSNYPRLMCNDSQVVRYSVSEQDADSDVRARMVITGYWRWAL